MPVQRAAKLSGLDSALIAHLEAGREVVDVDVVRRLAKAYNRNWYVFLLEDEPGAPAVPRDFRRLNRGAAISDETLIALDDAELLIDKILDLPRESGVLPMTLSNIAGMTADDAAQLIRDELGATLEAQRQHTALMKEGKQPTRSPRNSVRLSAVAGEHPSSRGRCRHAIPVNSTNMIAPKHVRSATRGRPRGSRGSSGSNGSIHLPQLIADLPHRLRQHAPPGRGYVDATGVRRPAPQPFTARF